jgi:hypothetical protein
MAFLFAQHSPVFYSAQALSAYSGLPVFGSVGLARPTTVTSRDWLFAGSAAVLVLAYAALLAVGRTGVPIGAM